MSRVQSSIGAAQYYGPFTGNEGLPSSVTDDGIFRYLVMPFDWQQANGDLPDTDADEDAGVLVIPAYSFITRAFVQVGTAWDSANDPVLVIGTEDFDGTTDDADGIHASLQKAALLAGVQVAATGNKIGAATGAEDIQLIVTVTEDTTGFTAGTAVVVVEYIPNYAL